MSTLYTCSIQHVDMGGQQLPWPLSLAPPPSLQDWWASTSFSSYYRKWNTLVHDWIYSYLFLDMRAVFPSKLPAILSTLFLSAFIHEYLLALGLGFASPVLMIEFAGLGGKMMSCWSHHVTVIIPPCSLCPAVFYFMRACASRRVANLVVLGSLSLGMANLIFYYTAEVAARIYCPRPVSLGTSQEALTSSVYIHYSVACL